MIGDPNDERLYTLTSADRPYRVIVQEMGEGAATVSERGVLLYVNRRLSELIGRDRRDLPWVLVGEVGLAAGTGRAGLPPVAVTSTTTAIGGLVLVPGRVAGCCSRGAGRWRCTGRGIIDARDTFGGAAQTKAVKVVITCRRRRPLAVHGPGRSAGASSGRARPLRPATGFRPGPTTSLRR